MTFQTLNPALVVQVAEFFARLERDQEAKDFHPHPFTPDEAVRLCAYEGTDYYCVMISGVGDIVAYGMLRGWDAGYTVPSLGIAVCSSYRGFGFGRKMMNHLHQVAASKGANRIRLRVYPKNTRAIHLYQSMGYQFLQELEQGQLVGYFNVQNDGAQL